MKKSKSRSKKNPSSFYGKKYLEGYPSLLHTDLTRWEDNGLYFGAAVFVSKIASAVGAKTILDVGCGRGFVVRHLRNLKFEADGIEYSEEAVEHSVCGAKQGDLTKKLPYEDSSYDLVTCLGVLSHIPKRKVLHSLRELRRVSREFLFTNILTVYGETQKHHMTFEPPKWWIARFKNAGWEQVPDFDEEIQNQKSKTGEQWASFWRSSE